MAGGLLGGLLGGILGGGKEPKVDTKPAEELTDEEKEKARKARTALYGTEGGVSGSELAPGQVGTRDTLFGN